MDTNLIELNRAFSGGGIFSGVTVGVVTNNTISDNTADFGGGVAAARSNDPLEQLTLATLGSEGKASAKKGPDELAADICSAIDGKAAKYPKRQRQRTILALDAFRSPAHTTEEVIGAFALSPFKDPLRNSGFQEIWLVGSTTSRTYRLEPPSMTQEDPNS